MDRPPTRYRARCLCFVLFSRVTTARQVEIEELVRTAAAETGGGGAAATTGCGGEGGEGGGGSEPQLSLDSLKRVLLSGRFRREQSGRHFVLLSLAEVGGGNKEEKGE